MSIYKDKYDGDRAICPYCGWSYQVDVEDYREDSRSEKCEEYGRKYLLQQDVDITHVTTPDCEINGEEHVWEANKRHPEHVFCAICGQCRCRSALLLQNATNDLKWIRTE